jgi:hypothetical protein
MLHNEFCSFLKREISYAFEERHLFIIASKKYNEKMFESDCLSAVCKVPSEHSIETWIEDNVLDIGDRSRGSYLAVSALCSRLTKNGEMKKALKITAYLQSMRHTDSESDDESGSEEPNHMLVALKSVYNASVKQNIEQMIAGLQAKPPDGVRYSKKLMDENRASVDKLTGGMKTFEEFIA